MFCLVLFWLTGPVFADLWIEPRPFETASSNGLFVASVVPGDAKRNRPTLELFKVEDLRRSSQWKIELANDWSPYEVLLSDDGQYVVTLDEHGRVGYNEVVAIYSRTGLIRSYSLEDFAGDFLKRARGIGLLFPESTSSRWWRTGSLQKLQGAGADARFGIWLPWAGRWFVWKLADGKLESLEGAALKKWNEIGSAWAHNILGDAPIAATDGGRRDRRDGYTDRVSACRFLGYLKDPADRKLLEKLLENNELNSWKEPELRNAADRSLAMFDGVDLDLLRWDGGFYRFGGADIQVRLAQKPAHEQVKVRYYIFDEGVKGNDWREAAPVASGRLERVRDGVVYFNLRGLKPGRYWAKVVWDASKTDPDELLYDKHEGTKDAPAPAAEPSDFTTGAPELFEVKAAKVIEVKLACDRPGAK